MSSGARASDAVQVGEKPLTKPSDVSELTGYMKKEGSFIRSWKRRYFTLIPDRASRGRSAILSYFDSEDDKNEKGHIEITARSRVEEKGDDGEFFAFQIINSDRTLKLKVESAVLRAKWMQYVNYVISQRPICSPEIEALVDNADSIVRFIELLKQHRTNPADSELIIWRLHSHIVANNTEATKDDFANLGGFSEIGLLLATYSLDPGIAVPGLEVLLLCSYEEVVASSDESLLATPMEQLKKLYDMLFLNPNLAMPGSSFNLKSLRSEIRRRIVSLKHKLLLESCGKFLINFLIISQKYSEPIELTLKCLFVLLDGPLKGKDLLGEMGCAGAAIKALQAHVKNDGVAEWGLKCMIHMIDGSDSNIARYFNSGCLETMNSLFQYHSKVGQTNSVIINLLIRALIPLTFSRPAVYARITSLGMLISIEKSLKSMSVEQIQAETGLCEYFIRFAIVFGDPEDLELSKSASTSLANSGIMASTIKFAVHFAEDASIISWIAKALKVFCRFSSQYLADYVSSKRDFTCPSVLVKILLEHPNSFSEICDHIIRVSVVMLDEAPSCRAEFARVGFMEAVNVVMKSILLLADPSVHADVLDMGVRSAILFASAQSPSEFQNVIIDSGFAETLYELVFQCAKSSSPEMRSIIQWCFRACIASANDNPDNATRMTEDEAFRATLITILSGDYDEETIEWTVRAFIVVQANNPHSESSTSWDQLNMEAFLYKQLKAHAASPKVAPFAVLSFAFVKKFKRPRKVEEQLLEVTNLHNQSINTADGEQILGYYNELKVSLDEIIAKQGPDAPGEMDAPVCCQKGHILQLRAPGGLVGWSCDAKSEPGGCRSNNDFKGKNRWCCHQCNFDYCGPCYDSKQSEALATSNSLSSSADGGGNDDAKQKQKSAFQQFLQDIVGLGNADSVKFSAIIVDVWKIDSILALKTTYDQSPTEFKSQVRFYGDIDEDSKSAFYEELDKLII